MIQLIKKHLTPILICAVAAGFYMYDFIVRIMPAAMTTDLMSYFSLHAGKLGILSSLFFWGYAPMQIPVGMLFDRFSARSLLTSTLLLTSLATIGFAFTNNFYIACACRFLMGMTTAFSFVGALVVGANWFRGQHFAMYTGLVQFLGSIGAIIGITPVVLLTNQYGWQHASLLIAALGLGLTALMWLVVKDAPKRKNLPKKFREHVPYREIFSNPQTWWVGLFGFAMWGPISVFAVLWGVPFFHYVYGISQVDAGNYVSVIWIAIALGGPTVGWLSKRLSSRKIPMLTCTLMGAVSSFFIIHNTHLPHPVLITLLALFGVSSSGQVLAFGLVVDLQPPKSRGAVIGFTNMTLIMGGLTMQPIVGYIMQSLWTGHTAQGIDIYSPHTYYIALMMVPICFLLGLFSVYFVKETHCKRVYPE